MKKNKKPIIIGVIIISMVLLVAGILLWHLDREDKEKQSAESHKVPMTQEGVFPYLIPNTSLVIQKVRSYDGVFIEDGSEDDIRASNGLYSIDGFASLDDSNNYIYDVLDDDTELVDGCSTEYNPNVLVFLLSDTLLLYFLDSY